jgi:stage II sporulation protein D
MKYFLLWLALLCPATLFSALPPAEPACVKVALFAPYKIVSVTVKTGTTPVRMTDLKDGAEIVRVEAGREFRLIAMGHRVRIAGLPAGPADLVVRGLRLQSADVEKGLLEISTPSLSSQKFNGIVEVKGASGHLAMIEHTKLEDYLASVVLYEAADGRHIEALKAQAIVSRTFALKGSKRHADGEYDLCSSTHCQVYKGYVPETHPVVAAVRATAGMVLQYRGRLIDAHYSSNCGGQTAQAGEIWPSAGQTYLTSVRDDYCQGRLHSAWRFRVKSQSVWKALKSDARTDPGLFLRQIRILNYGPSGRVTRVAIDGEHHKVVDGWQFRQIMTRSLGWGSIKSTFFKLTVDGSDFLFEGRGFGHGMGLCQTGAQGMAQRGFNALAILRHYYPAAKVARSKDAATVSLAPLLYRTPDVRVRSSEHFVVKLAGGVEADELDDLLALLERIRTSYQERTGRAPDTLTEVIVHPSTAAFTRATGRPWWVAAVTGAAIEIQPVRTLKARGILQSTLRHEYAHVLINAAARKPPPLWLAEGFAVYLAGEGARLQPAPGVAPLSEEKLDAVLRAPANKDAMQAAYYLAYQKVKSIIAQRGEPAIWNLLAQPQMNAAAGNHKETS